MTEFCKIITLKDGHQVLVIMTFNDEEPEDGQYQVERITEYDGVRMTAKGGYPTERLQLADYETFGEEEAQRFFNKLKALSK